MKITDKYFTRENGSVVTKFHLLYIDGDKKHCDGCDEPKICASVVDITGTVSIICKDCLQDLINEFK